MKVRYLGPHDEGEVVTDTGVFRVVRGEISEVPDEVGALLVQNPEQYESAEPGRRKKAAPADEKEADA